MKKRKLLERILAGSKNVKFSEMGALKDYHINIFFSEEDKGYIADTPDLKACSAFGKTPAKALAEVELAKKAWLEAARKEGKSIPKPKYRPLIYQVATPSPIA